MPFFASALLQFIAFALAVIYFSREARMANLKARP